jgi:DNA-directed RNA polymerase subunit F
MRSLFASADKEQFDDEMANFIIRGTDVDDIINTFNFGDELSKDTLKKSFILVKEAFNVTEAKASEILKPEVLEELDMDMEETDKLITALEQSILELAGEFFSLNPVKLEKFEDDFIDTDKTGNEVATAYEKYFI